MNIQLFAVIAVMVLVVIASFFININYAIHSVANALDTSWLVVSCVIFTLIGAAFYFLARVAGIFESRKEIQDFLFYEIKEALEESRFTYMSPGFIMEINGLVKMEDGEGESFFVIVNNDFKTLHQVTPAGMAVNITQYSIRFLQDNFVDENDLINYINTRTRHRVTKFEPIFDTLVE